LIHRAKMIVIPAQRLMRVADLFQAGQPRQTNASCQASNHRSWSRKIRAIINTELYNAGKWSNTRTHQVKVLWAHENEEWTTKVQTIFSSPHFFGFVHSHVKLVQNSIWNRADHIEM
jgi:hypothetical protein